MKKLLLPAFIFFALQGLISQPGTIDLSFNPNDIGFGHGDGPNNYILCMATQPDGKIFIGGIFTTYNGIPCNHIARLHPDGTLDLSFDSGTGFDGDYGSISVSSIHVLTNGKIMVGGIFNGYQGHSSPNLVRLNPDGSLDNSFDTGTGPNKNVTVIREQEDGKILIGGLFASYNGYPANLIARLHPDGNLDDTFQGPDYTSNYGINEILILPDDRIMIGGVFTFAGGSGNHLIARLLQNGSLDDTFNASFSTNLFAWSWSLPGVMNIQRTANNKYIITGGLRLADDSDVKCVIRLNEDGSLDENFIIPHIVLTGGSYVPYVRFLYHRDDGKLIIFGRFSSADDEPYQNIAQLNSDGTLDTSVPPKYIESVYNVIIQENDRYVITSLHGDYGFGETPLILVRINEDFTYDGSFNANTGAFRNIRNLLLLDEQEIIINGNIHFYNGNPVNTITRIMPDGSYDWSFDSREYFRKDGISSVMVHQPDGRLLLTGSSLGNVAPFPQLLRRLNSDGGMDTTFYSGDGFNSSIYDIKIRGDNKIIVGGSFNSYDNQTVNRLIRLHPDGMLDETFSTGSGANGYVYRVEFQSDGKMIIAGGFSMYDSIPRNRIASLNADGSIDVDFDPGHGLQKFGGVNNPIIYEMGFQQDGKIIVAGNFLMYNDVPVNRIMRLNPDGSLDTAFTPGYGPQGEINDMLIQPDDKIIIGGRLTMFNNTPVGYFARLNTDGSLDTTFQSGTGFNNFVETLALQEDGNILAGGWFTAYDGTGRNRIARIKGGGPEGVPLLSSQNNWIAFPNPTSDYFTLKSERYAMVNHIRLYDLQGRMVLKKQNLSGTQFTIQTGSIPPGVYIVEVHEADHVSRLKIIKH